MLKPSTPKLAPCEAAEEDKDRWILVSHCKKHYKEVALVKITIRRRQQKKVQKTTSTKPPKINKPRADWRRRRHVMHAALFPEGFINPTALIATCSTSSSKQTAKKKGKAPMAESLHNDLDCHIWSYRALAKILDKPKEVEAEVERLEMGRNDEPKVGLSPPMRKNEEDVLLEDHMKIDSLMISYPPFISFKRRRSSTRGNDV